MKNRFEIWVKDKKTGKEELVASHSDENWVDGDCEPVTKPTLSFVANTIKAQLEAANDAI